MSQVEKKRGNGWLSIFLQEDWWAVWLGFIIITGAALGKLNSPVLPGRWGREGAESIFSSVPPGIIIGIILTGIIALILFGISTFASCKKEIRSYVIGFPIVFLIAVLAELLGNYAPLRHYGMNNVIWALALGLLISNTVKTPQAIKGAMRMELYIKTGLVLMGASILFNRMLSLGTLGLGVAWLVTPVVLIFMYWFSQKYLKMQGQKGLAISIASATSVCGVSAAIAAGTAAKAKKEEITLAISVTLIFTVLMMIGMPIVIRVVGMDPIVGGAWLGGTIDATGAVVASAALLGEEALQVASVIKMIQNILIGIIAFIIALVWVTAPGESSAQKKVSPVEIWVRLPKFILGFIAASLIFSFVIPAGTVSASSGIINSYRDFFFTLAFVSIGLDSNFGDMARLVKGGSPVKLYLVGQTFNVVLTLLAAYVFFGGRFFPLPF